VYGIPLLNYLGQFVMDQQAGAAIFCLVEAGIDLDRTTPPSADVPVEINAYRQMPLLLQLVEVGFVELIHLLVSKGVDITTAYRPPDGSTSQLSSLHAAFMISDPTYRIRMAFQDRSREQLKGMSSMMVAQIEQVVIY
jgi:hypothetical protein